jgi:HEAT repeat protein
MISAVTCALLAVPPPAAAQPEDFAVGAFLYSSLGMLVKRSPHIVLLQVERVDRDKSIISFRKAADLKGKDPSSAYQHFVGKAQGILDWVRPGRLAVCFHDGERGGVWLGSVGYGCRAQKLPAWNGVYCRNQIPLIYMGSVEKLCDHVRAIQDGQVVVITARSRDAHDNDISRLIYQDWPRGKKGRVWRVKAGLKIEDFAESDESPLFVGWGVGGPEVVPALTAALRDPDSLVRAEAAQDLGQLGPVARAAAADLRRALKDDDVYVRIHAAVAAALVEPASAPPLATLVEALQDSKEDVRVAGIAVLASLAQRGRPAIPALIGALSDPEDRVRRAAALALGELAPERMRATPGPEIAALARALQKDESLDVRHMAVRALGNYGSEAWAAAPALRQALCDEAPRVARDAADLLARFGAPAADMLAAAVQDPQATDRAWSVRCLGEIGPKARAAIPALMGALKEEKTDLRLEAAWALLRIAPGPGRKAAVPVLLALLKEPSLGLRANVLATLEDVGPDKAVVQALCPLIAKWREDGFIDNSHRWHAEEILGKMGPDAVEAVPVLRAALQHGDAYIRQNAAVALWQIGRHREGIPVLVRELRLKEWSIRGQAAKALGRIGPGAREALPALRDALQWRSDRISPHVALALWRVAGPEGADPGSAADRRQAVELLIGMLREGDRFVRWAALDALATIGPEARPAVPALVPLLKDEDAQTRQPAVAVLGVLARQAPEAVAPLCWALDDRAVAVRAQAARCLYRLGRWHPRALPALKEALERDPTAAPPEDVLRALGPEARALVPPLLRALRHPERRIYLAAARTLQAIDPQAAATVWGVPATARLPWEGLSTRQLEELWGDLADPHLPRAFRAVWTLALAGEPAAAFLGQRLRPAPHAAPEQVARLIADLGSDRFITRQKATAELEKVVDAAAPALRRVLAAKPPEEVRRRLERLLDGLDPANSPARLTAMRALEVLEQIGTARARQVLRGLAGGAPRARLTLEAQAALERLGQSGAATP